MATTIAKEISSATIKLGKLAQRTYAHWFSVLSPTQSQ